MEPTLYILMRKDIPDMNPGKAMAQAAHAQAEFDSSMQELIRYFSLGGNNCSTLERYAVLQAYGQWLGEREFGKTIVLSMTKSEIAEFYEQNKDQWQKPFSPMVVIDPTYPWTNWYGESFVESQMTCGVVFVAPQVNGELFDVLSEYPLHQ